MPEKDPATYGLVTYAWVLLLSFWGGAVSFMRKLKAGEVRVFNVTELIGELVTSGFAGVITFYLCQWSNFPDLLTAALVGVSGHMGSRAIFHLENLFKSKLAG